MSVEKGFETEKADYRKDVFVLSNYFPSNSFSFYANYN